MEAAKGEVNSKNFRIWRARLTLFLPYDNKLGTEVGSQIHRDPDGLSNQGQAPVVPNQNMGVQAELLHFLSLQTGFFLLCPAPFFIFPLLLLQCDSFDVEELPLGLSWPFLQTSEQVVQGYDKIDNELSVSNEKTQTKTRYVPL